MNSVTNKINYLFNLIKTEALEVVSVTETWLTGSCSSSFVSIPGFTLHRGDVAGNVRKHGAALYISDGLKQVQVDVLLPNVAVVQLVDFDLYVLSVYRPPSYNSAENLALINFLIDFLPGKEILMLGDFNLPTLKWSVELVPDSYMSPNDSLFYDCFSECGLFQWVTFGTFFPSNNTLDLILTTDEDRIGEVYSSPPLPGCHHCPVTCSVIFQFNVEAEQMVDDRLSWSNANYAGICEDLMSVDWELAFSEMDIHECYDYFVSVVGDCIEEHVPLRPVYRGGRWLSEPPRAVKSERKRLWALYKQSRRCFGRSSQQASLALGNYQEINRTYRNYARLKQGRYEERLVSLISEAPKLFHSYLRERKKGCPSVGPLRNSEGSLIYSNLEMSEEFARAFSAVYIATTPDRPSQYQFYDGSMEEISVSYDKVLTVLQALSSSTSPGPDGIHPAILKNCASVVALPLMLIIRRSLEVGVVPREWKRSRVVPIFKTGSKCSPLNYRPVSLTSCCCKVAERLLSEHIYDYLQQNNLLSTRQFGFRRGHSAEDQLLLTYSKIVAEVDDGQVVDAVYLDYSKAFDVLSHNILLEKLTSIGFCPIIINWIRSFLCGRAMQVAVNGVSSEPRDVLSGVPQGSVLGPLLFIIYVNSLGVNFGCEWYAFADDLKLFVSQRRMQILEPDVSLQRDLDTLFQVSVSWNLSLNPAKCAVVRFGARSTYEAGGDSGYRLGGDRLALARSHRDLGVIVDTSLRFHLNVSAVVQKASALVNQLLRNTVCRSPEFMVTLFVSHVRPILDYCSTVWNLGFLGDMRKLESVQRRWTREVTGLSRTDYGVRLQRLKLFSVLGRFLRSDIIKVWKVFNSEIATGLEGMFEREFHRATRGHAFKLSNPLCHSETRRRFLNARVVGVWNGLPSTVVECRTVESFKARLDQHMGEVFYDFLV